MRIAVVSTSYPAFPGDPSGHFVETEARLLAKSAEVVVITAGGLSARPAPAHEGGGVVVWREDGGDAFGWPGVAARLRERPWSLASAALWTRRAHARLSALGPFDRVVAHWALPSAFPVARSISPSLEIVSHGGDVRLVIRLPSVARRVVMERLLGSATRWRFVSQSLHDSLARVLSLGHERRLAKVAYVAPPAIDLPDVAARASRLRTHEGPLKVCVGRLVTSKRFDRAFDHVARDAKRGTRVVVVGDGPERRRLETHARSLGIDARFVGRTTRTEALAWIGAADALLHASHTEGLSTVVREAEALGVPVEIVA